MSSCSRLKYAIWPPEPKMPVSRVPESVPLLPNGSFVSLTTTRSVPLPPSTVIVLWMPFASPLTLRNVPVVDQSPALLPM